MLNHRHHRNPQKDVPSQLSMTTVICALSFLVAGLGSMTGCASMYDVELVREDLQKSLNETTKKIDAKIDAKASQLQAQVDAKLINQDRVIEAQQAAVLKLSEMTKETVKESMQLRTALQTDENAVLAALNAEEAFFKEGLRSVQAILTDLTAAKTRAYRDQSDGKEIKTSQSETQPTRK